MRSMHHLVRLSGRLIAGLAFFAGVVAAFRKTPIEDRDPEPVAREIDKLVDPETLPDGADLGIDLRRARTYYRRRKWEPQQWPVP
jgi:hypothetical protein